ncbi:hypothetical protein RHGRI_008566 [Rhododendron griersonianum]|uniref:Uncharacterized protein n=1 Tax=Rhododendron griersonianum TaxID=479676 RepID=A0AAV6L311_9ERIC|nr:hypothetical protein RHGRI_008566 [Rhododendron griersonianum]
MAAKASPNFTKQRSHPKVHMQNQNKQGIHPKGNMNNQKSKLVWVKKTTPIKARELGNEWLHRSATAKLSSTRPIMLIQDYLRDLGHAHVLYGSLNHPNGKKLRPILAHVLYGSTATASHFIYGTLRLFLKFRKNGREENDVEANLDLIEEVAESVGNMVGDEANILRPNADDLAGTNGGENNDHCMQLIALSGNNNVRTAIRDLRLAEHACSSMGRGTVSPMEIMGTDYLGNDEEIISKIMVTDEEEELRAALMAQQTP